MPNWCNNVVEISHEDPAMMQRVKTSFNDGRLLDEFIPVPKDLHITAGRVGDKDSPEQIELESQEKTNLEKYGYSTWYDYCVNEWGTKWDVSPYEPITADIENNQMTLSFDTAWAPPVAAYEKLEELGFTIKAYYYECGMGFAGMYFSGYDDYYEFDSLSSDDVENMLPEDLNEMFNISESMAEWEAENEEENE